MSDTQKHKHTCRLWRVNIDGRIVEGRWKNAMGAINGAADKLFGNAGLREERPDYTDLVIHVECIGEAEPHPAPHATEPRTVEPPTLRRPLFEDALHWEPS